MNKRKILLAALMTVFLTGCFGESDIEIENRELNRQIDTLQSRLEFLQGEVDRLIQGGQTEDTNLKDEENREGDLLCGGIAKFLCPDGYICLDKGPAEEDTGVCVAVDKVEEYRARQEAASQLSATNSEQSATTDTDSQVQKEDEISFDASTCGVLGEKINRNPLLGATSRSCCAGLVEDRVSKSYSICRAAGTVESTTPSNEDDSQTDVGTPAGQGWAGINERCGGEEKIACASGLFCRTTSEAPDAEGICINDRDACAGEGEILLDTRMIRCCAGLQVKDGVCTADYGEYREANDTSGTTQNYTVSGYMTYETKTGGFSISYPQYWYWGGYGATGDSQWMAGFGPDPLEDDGSNVVIMAKLKSGAPSGRSWAAGSKAYCTKALDSTHHIEVSGPSDLADKFCTMADSAALIQS